MQFNEANRIVAKMFAGKYRSVTYKEETWASGRVETTCTIYVEGRGIHVAPTFNAAISRVGGYREESQIIDDGSPDDRIKAIYIDPDLIF